MRTRMDEGLTSVANLQKMTQMDSALQIAFSFSSVSAVLESVNCWSTIGTASDQDGNHSTTPWSPKRIGKSPSRIPLVGVTSRIHDVASVCGKTTEELTLLPPIAHRYGRRLKSGHLKREFWPICGENTDKPNNPINRKDSTQPRMI